MRNDQNISPRIKAMMITAIIFCLIMVVAYFARQKVTNWMKVASENGLEFVASG